MEDAELIMKSIDHLPNSYISKDEFKFSQTLLQSYVTNKDNYRTNQFKIINGIKIKQDYSSKNQRRSYYNDCVFENAVLNHGGFTGSVFLNCKFIDCHMNFCIFDSCIFENCEFIYNLSMEILGTSFCRSVFRNTSIGNCYLHACFFTDASFIDFKFFDCKIIDIIWENAIFRNSFFKSVKLDNLNFEFVQFHNTRFIDTIIPFATIPYIFNGLSYILSTDDNIKIESEDPNNKNKFITREEYITLIPHLIKFYTYTQNYFPLANIFISLQEYEKAFKTIKEGIPFVVRLREFRLLRYFSILMQLNKFEFHQKKEIYDLINSEIAKCSLSTEEYRNWSLYIAEIRDNLLNQKDKPYLTLELSTNIQTNEYEKLTKVIEVLESVIKFVIIDTHYIEIRHNSPFEFFVSIFSDIDNILQILGYLYMAFAGFDFFNNKFLSYKKAKLDNEKEELEIEILKQTIKENEIKKGSTEESSEKLTNCKEYFDLLNKYGIVINHVNHNIYNNEYVDMSVQYSIINPDIENHTF